MIKRRALLICLCILLMPMAAQAAEENHGSAKPLISPLSYSK